VSQCVSNLPTTHEYINVLIISVITHRKIIIVSCDALQSKLKRPLGKGRQHDHGLEEVAQRAGQRAFMHERPASNDAGFQEDCSTCKE
jgi:hypothetical protein